MNDLARLIAGKEQRKLDLDKLYGAAASKAEGCEGCKTPTSVDRLIQWSITGACFGLAWWIGQNIGPCVGGLLRGWGVL